MDYYIGQRLSLKDQLCTIRYTGSVDGKAGEWLGVEWDDTSRGKHDGTFDGTKYFKCESITDSITSSQAYSTGRSSAPTAASFLRPKQPWDRARSFLQALKEKYMPEDAGKGGEIVYFSSKKAEEVGFAKFAKRQAQLQGIHVIVLDHMRISLGGLKDESDAVAETCANITDLDLGSNLFESFDEIMELVGLLPKLRNIVLDGNRLNDISARRASTPRILKELRSFGLSNTLLEWPEIAFLMQSVPNLASLALDNNELKHIGAEALPETIQTLDLAANDFTALSDLKSLVAYPNIRNLVLKHNQISAVAMHSKIDLSVFSHSVESIDLAYNAVTSWSFFDLLDSALPSLKHLRVAGNPLYSKLISAEGKTLTAEDGYMLTIARLPHLETLNYSKVGDKERLNSETYYLGQIAVEFSRAPIEQAAEIVSRHPRWKALCEEYGEPAVQRQLKQDELDPNSLAAKLVTFTFVLADGILSVVKERLWNEEIPKSFETYTVLGMIGKRLGIVPLKLRLVWETGEQDPVGRDGGYTGPEEWDSSDEEGTSTTQEGELVAREVELVAGTRAVGTYIEGREARVRIELNS